jgi:hypothetical protein
METSETPEFRPSPDVVAQRVGDTLVVVHLKTNRIYSLNHTAARVWELLDRGLTRAGIRDEILKDFRVDETELESEIDSLIASLTTETLLCEA